MNKVKAQPAVEAKPQLPEVKAYTVIHKNGGYQIVEFTMVGSVIKNIQEIGPEDVYAIASSQLNTLIRSQLGI